MMNRNTTAPRTHALVRLSASEWQLECLATADADATFRRYATRKAALAAAWAAYDAAWESAEAKAAAQREAEAQLALVRRANTTQLAVVDYRAAHGGLDVMIDGREASIGSVVGYSLYCEHDPVQAVLSAVERKHALVWINLSATVLCSDAGYYERQEARRAAMPKLSTGSLITFEGKAYEITPAPNQNFGLRCLGDARDFLLGR